MFSKKMILATASLVLAFSTVHAADINADKNAVDSACSQEATTAGCTGEKVGSGLLKCIFSYKKAHKDFKLSEGCKTAVQTLKTDKATK